MHAKYGTCVDLIWPDYLSCAISVTMERTEDQETVNENMSRQKKNATNVYDLLNV